MSLFNLTAYELQEKLQKKEIKSEEIIIDLFNRIEKVEDSIKAFLFLNKDGAIKEAKALDEKRARGENLPKYAGIPIAVKDNICTKGIKTTCASKILNNFIPPYNATVVNKLKSSGLIIIGKTNLDEFAMGSSTENSGMQTTKNPWNIECVPGGSSGGSAASVAAREVPWALGSDTGGSIRQPASFCGVVGMKPTYGAVSRFGLVAFASSLDQIGTITKDIRDTAILLNVICGYDKNDSTSANIDYPDNEKFLENNIKGMKIGIIKELMGEGINEEIKDITYKAIELLKDLGAECEEVSLNSLNYALSTYYIVAPAEASANLARYDGVRYGHRNKQAESLREMYTKTRNEGFGDEVKRRILLGTYVLSSGYYDAYYSKALKVRTLIRQDFEKAFEKYDCLISATSPTVAFKVGERMDDPLSMYMSDIATIPVNLAGLPAISVNSGFVNKMPVGLQIIGKPFDEGTVLRTAYAFEQNIETDTKGACPL